MSASRHLSVGVTVDLELSGAAGGHVKVWQRFAEAAAAADLPIDLTVYFLGEREDIQPLSGRARYHLLPARRGTRQLGLDQGAGHTDLAPHHPALDRRLGHHDVLHTTSAFSLSRTAGAHAVAHGKPLVGSIHTDLPFFTRVYAGEVIGSLIGSPTAARMIADYLGFAGLSAWQMDRRVRRVLAPSRHVFYAQETTRAWLTARLSGMPSSLLRRGVDRELFNPQRRDRARLIRRFGIPEDATVLLFVGRADASKNVMVAAVASRLLRDRGLPVHLLVIGDGSARRAVTRCLGAHATAPGGVSQEDVAWIYASADLFVFPSLSETVGNVVLEAKAAGLPVAVAAGTAPARFVAQPSVDGLVIDGTGPTVWADALEGIIRNEPARAEMGQAARAHVIDAIPSWVDVVAEDLLPVWRRAAMGAGTPLAA